MSLWALLWSEAWHRKATSVLTILAMALALTSSYLMAALAYAETDETRVIQRDMGLNLRILPEGTDLQRYWSQGFSEQSMPEEWLKRLHQQEVANRLVPLLRRRVPWAAGKALLTGIEPEIFKGKQQREPVFSITPAKGTAILGAIAADSRQLATGDSFDLLGQALKVERVLGPSGSEEDLVIYTSLEQAQELLQLPGRINEIQALECHCGTASADPLTALQEQLAPLLPGALILRDTRAADARRKQRILADQVLRWGTPPLLALVALWISTLSFWNVRQRRQEIGVLRALGRSSTTILKLILGRAILLGGIGTLLGWFLSVCLAQVLQQQVFQVAALSLPGLPTVLLVVLALVFSVSAGLIPAALAVRLDPAEALLDE